MPSALLTPPLRARFAAQRIKILQAPWNEDFLRELENFPEGRHDDIVDALSGAFFDAYRLCIRFSTLNHALT